MTTNFDRKIQAIRNLADAIADACERLPKRWVSLREDRHSERSKVRSWGTRELAKGVADAWAKDGTEARVVEFTAADGVTLRGRFGVQLFV